MRLSTIFFVPRFAGAGTLPQDPLPPPAPRGKRLHRHQVLHGLVDIAADHDLPFSRGPVEGCGLLEDLPHVEGRARFAGGYLPGQDDAGADPDRDLPEKFVPDRSGLLQRLLDGYRRADRPPRVIGEIGRGAEHAGERLPWYFSTYPPYPSTFLEAIEKISLRFRIRSSGRLSSA